MKKAEKLLDINKSFKADPLAPEDIPVFYCETHSVRGGSKRQRIIDTLLQAEDDNQHILFVGHKGCGKSTELNHLQKDLQQHFLVTNYSVQTELDSIHLSYIELFIVTMEKLFEAADERSIDVNAEFLKRVKDWTQTTEIQQIKERYFGLDTQVGAEAKFGIPYFKNFFAQFKTSARVSRSLKEILKQDVEPRLSQLINLCNELITEISIGISKNGQKGIVIIIEDLDKIPLERARTLFCNYSRQLTSVKTNIIYSFPISLYNSIHYNTIRQYYTMVYELPMIKINNRDGSAFPEGKTKLTEVVSRRMNLSLFENIEDLSKLIGYSGGCIRDLFLMIREAAASALDYEREQITSDDCRSAILLLKRDYSNSIADNVDDGINYPVEKYFNILVELASSTTKKVDNTTELMHLKDNLCVLSYNGEGWLDVHPIVKEILIERRKWDGIVK
ncbi:MAG: ATP-binding protein [Bacteroidia bacterium]|jgi:energy-coupling factor transporter ATP-binding protein EcfA2|nr:ATP-binding protein [Bacteroidia bacterium]